jgi:tRNA(fMet)-specific endonuclease VapC
MKLFDTDILSLMIADAPAVVSRAAAIPLPDQTIAVVSVEEVFRGQLNALRTSAAGKGKAPLPKVYDYLLKSVARVAAFRILPYTPAADAEFNRLRSLKVRIGTQDLRIASVALTLGATLVTRNARDYRQVPGLALDVWN